MKNAPIGIFDSGIGGLTVAAAINKAFPKESILYFGDTAHLPYGEKSIDSIQRYSVEIADFLLEKGCKMLVIACNSASAAAYDLLMEKYGHKVPIVDVISPLVQLIASKPFKKVGVMATKATVSSNVYSRKLHELKPSTEVASLAASILVTMIEEGFFNNDISHAVLHKYLTYPDFENIEALLLACTHYPLIKPEIEAFYNGRVAVFDSVDSVTERVRELLSERDLFNEGTSTPIQRFFVSDYTQSFEQTTRIFYQKEVHLEVANLEELNDHKIHIKTETSTLNKKNWLRLAGSDIEADNIEAIEIAENYSTELQNELLYWFSVNSSFQWRFRIFELLNADNREMALKVIRDTDKLCAFDRIKAYEKFVQTTEPEMRNAIVHLDRWFLKPSDKFKNMLVLEYKNRKKCSLEDAKRAVDILFVEEPGSAGDEVSGERRTD